VLRLFMSSALRLLLAAFSSQALLPAEAVWHPIGHQSGDRAVFFVHVPEDGAYRAKLLGGARQTLVNGRPTTEPLATAGQHQLDLRQGLNTIAYHSYAEALPMATKRLYVEGSLETEGVDAKGSMPFQTLEAEHATCNGAVIGPTYDAYGETIDLPTEASGRKACQLSNKGHYVEFTVSSTFNAYSLRYSVPDGPQGEGMQIPVSILIDGVRQPDMILTSYYSWYYGKYPYNNNPADGDGHHFYNEDRSHLGRSFEKGAKVQVFLNVSWGVVTIDLIDMYHVGAPYARPKGSVSVLDHGADPTGVGNCHSAFTAASDAAGEGGAVWVPQGKYLLVGVLQLMPKVSIHGAGPWYTEVHAPAAAPLKQEAFVFGLHATMGQQGGTVGVGLYDFAIIGNSRDRIDSNKASGVMGAPIGGSTIQNLWIHHTKCGMWLNGPGSDLVVAGNIIRDTMADGINLNIGWSEVTVEQNSMRNVGDDGIALWSLYQADHGMMVRNNLVQLPILANGIAVYGGHDNNIEDNVIEDTIEQGGGIHVGNRFNAVPHSGTTLVSGNVLNRCGAPDKFWHFGIPAIWMYASDGTVGGTISVKNTRIIDSPFSAFGVISDSDYTVNGLDIESVTVEGVATFVFQAMCLGSGRFQNVQASAIGYHAVYACSPFKITDAGGNSDWLRPCTTANDAMSTCPSNEDCPSGFGFCEHCGFPSTVNDTHARERIEPFVVQI
jgi:hypothetical protein